nr:MG2 domain-containing protein [Kofleriaceae bacterium]
MPATTSGAQPAARPPTATDVAIAAIPATALTASDDSKHVDDAIAAHFERAQTQRAYVMTDKPLYQPGETIYYRADVRRTGTLVGATLGMTMQLVSPRGAIVAQHRVQLQGGVATNGFELDPAIDGGEYILRLLADDGTKDDKKLVINTYEAPRVQKSIEFVRKAYGARDTVTAAVELKRATGEALANHAFTAVVTLDDGELARLALTTDAQGHAAVKFALPASVGRGDGLLSVLVDDGGVTEATQKRVPIVTTSIGFAMYPEGGDLIEGLPGRVYFAATNAMGKPADVEGRVVDDRGLEVAKLSSVHDGMGRFELQPAADRSYRVEITQPANIAQKFDLPAAKAGGCAVRAVSESPLKIAAICSASRTLEIEAVMREKRVAGGELAVEAGKPAVVELPIDAAAGEGAVRVTLLSAKHEPLAERLMFHGRGRDMQVSIAADRASYGPRDTVKLHVRTADADGKPVAASVGVAVVDDTVLTFADDKSARMLAHLYLDDDLPGATDIEEPNFYFSAKPEAPAAMDALLATRGYRRFEWKPVFEPPPPPPPPGELQGRMEDDDLGADLELEEADGGGGGGGRRGRAPQQAKARNVERRPLAVATGAAAVKTPVAQRPVAAAPDAPRANEQAHLAAQPHVGHAHDHRVAANRERVDAKPIAGGWAPVRVFPVPDYAPNYDGPRSDFRETIYWNGDVQTSAAGTADVSFVTSDSVTSFRATAEGVSAAGLPGAGAAVFQSKLPITLDVHLPTEVTAGDLVRLPVTISNDTDRDLDADLTAQFGSALALQQDPRRGGKLRLRGGDKQTLMFPLSVAATAGDATVDLAVTSHGLADQLHKTIRVVPRGFPLQATASGTAQPHASARHELTLAGAMPGSMSATVTMFPSPVAAMTQGMAGMIREPGGCFEQTSSTNYPNIMILGYLEQNNAADPALLAKTTTTLDHGYKLLTGYETPDKGYEWFGRSPGHEALTAYGLMEFADMGKVYDVDTSMVERTATWLMSRRDGKGGFARSSEALDSFGRAGETTTTAYIMWALAEAKRTGGMTPELAAQRALGATTQDPYLLALAANTEQLAAPGGADGAAAVKRLAAMQGKDGSFAGAKESITKSGGESLTIETTSLAVMAMIKAGPAYEAQIRAGVDWLNGKRGGYGQWGNTQATILGLKSLTAYAQYAARTQSGGKATLVVNGKSAGTIAFDKGRQDALVWDDLGGLLEPGKNTVEIQLDSDSALPYTVTIDYRSAKPATSPAAKVALATSIARGAMTAGDSVKLHAHVENVTADGVPMTIARVGIPGGLVFQTWQLKELRDKGLVDFYETRPREVVLYWRALAPHAIKDVDLQLIAQVPGRYEAPASSAYLYYTAEDKSWAPPVEVDVAK